MLQSDRNALLLLLAAMKKVAKGSEAWQQELFNNEKFVA